MYARDEHGTEHRVQVVKLCFIAYLDGIETANPLGVARGSHSMECVYVALLNLPLRSVGVAAATESLLRRSCVINHYACRVSTR